jgi:hypothetical protein
MPEETREPERRQQGRPAQNQWSLHKETSMWHNGNNDLDDAKTMETIVG